MGCLCSRNLPDVDGYVSIEGYVGEKNCWGQKDGRGQYYFSNGDTYDGSWKRNEKHGYGTYTYANGDRQQGYFSSDEFFGTNLPEGSDDPTLKRSDSAKTLSRPPSVTEEQRQLMAARAKEEEARKAQQRVKSDERRQLREQMRKKWLDKR